MQANSNNKTMEIFFQQLVHVLDKENKDWRKDTLIVLDNAPYHTSAATLGVFRRLKLPISFTGPHSYDASPCELMYAHFKCSDINPSHLPLGKRYVFISIIP